MDGGWGQEIPPSAPVTSQTQIRRECPHGFPPRLGRAPDSPQNRQNQGFGFFCLFVLPTFTIFRSFLRENPVLAGGRRSRGCPRPEAAAWPEPVRALGSLQCSQTPPHAWGHAWVIGAAQAAAAEIRGNRAPARTGMEAAAGGNSAPAARASLSSPLAWW